MLPVHYVYLFYLNRDVRILALPVFRGISENQYCFYIVKTAEHIISIEHGKQDKEALDMDRYLVFIKH